MHKLKTCKSSLVALPHSDSAKNTAPNLGCAVYLLTYTLPTQPQSLLSSISILLKYLHAQKSPMALHCVQNSKSFPLHTSTSQSVCNLYFGCERQWWPFTNSELQPGFSAHLPLDTRGPLWHLQLSPQHFLHLKQSLPFSNMFSTHPS